MPIHGTCPTCGGETMDYGCVSCLADENAKLRAALNDVLAITDKAQPGESLAWEAQAHLLEFDLRQIQLVTAQALRGKR